MKIYRSLLFTPGNNMRMMYKLMYGVYPDAVILDLEDSVPSPEKDTARIFIRDMVPKLSKYGHNVFVRINIEEYDKDLEYAVVNGLRGIVIPKSEDPNQIKNIDKIVGEREDSLGIRKGEVGFILLIETPKGVVNIRDIVTSSNRIIGLALGAEDLTYSMGISRPTDRNIAFPRAYLPLVAHAYGILPIDKVYTDIDDLDGLYKETSEAKELGYRGKLIIHPRQIDVVNQVLKPSNEEINWANKVVEAYEAALKTGKGATTLGSEMIDKPTYERAKKILGLMKAIDELESRWVKSR